MVKSKSVWKAPFFRSGMNGELHSSGYECLESLIVQGNSVAEAPFFRSGVSEELHS